MDELERAGRTLRDSVAVETEPNDRVRARARTIVRRRRAFAAGSVATAVVAASIGVAVAISGGDGLGVHTIAPAGSTTSRAFVTSDVRPTVPPTLPAYRDYVQVQALPMLTFVDALHGWRVEPLNRRTLEHTADGGRTWTPAQISVPGDDTSLTGVVAIDDRHVFSIVVNGIGNAIPRLIRTTDGVHWSQTRGVGMPRSEGNTLSVGFSDSTHGWAVTEFGELLGTTDGGDNWKVMEQPVRGSVALVAAVCPVNARSGWVATGRAVYRTDDGGATWIRQAALPVGGGSDISLVCNGAHAAFASYGIGAGQHIGGFLRTDDEGAHWRAIVEDTDSGTVTMPGYPDMQIRGVPSSMSADGTLAVITGDYYTEPTHNRVVVASPGDVFVIGKFDSTAAQQVASIVAGAIDASHAFVEVQRVTRGVKLDEGPVFVSLYASSDGGRTWNLRWSTSG
jgi:photosystem II stability/assembly factor-like uncharacterized protein